jgi:hypothetical protein
VALEVGRAFVDLVPRLADDFADKVNQQLKTGLDKVGAKLDSVGKDLTTKVTLPIVAGLGVSVFKAN